MADSKITALTSIGASTDPANDPLVLVDVSDTSMAATGTTKKVTLNQLLGASGTATLASATITGDLTVDTSTLKVDSANNRVGIGTASPNSTLEVAGSIRTTSSTGSATASIGVFDYVAGTTTRLVSYGANTTTAGAFQFVGLSSNASVGDIRYAIDATGVATWSNVGGVAGTAMTLNSTGLGVGVSPSTKFHVKSTGSTPARIETSGGGLSYLQFTSTTGDAYVGNNGNGLAFYTSGSADLRMSIDSSGNVLVGTTTTSGNAGGLKLSNVAGNLGQITFSNNSGSADYVARFNWGSTPDLVGTITVSSGGTAFNTTSDYRLKESVQPIVGGLARVNALKPSIYKWKTDGSNGEGFLAHELAETVPLAVTGEKDAVNEDGSIKPQGVDLSKVVPILVAAIKELTARVQTLEAK